MNPTIHPFPKSTQRLETTKSYLKKQIQTLSRLRLGSFLVFVSVFVVVPVVQLPSSVFYASVVPGILFVFFVFQSVQKETLLQKIQIVLRFYTREKNRRDISLESLPWTEFPQDRELWKDHPFAKDLDIPGEEGILKLVDTTVSKEGQTRFRKNLLQLEEWNFANIMDRQTKVKAITNQPGKALRFLKRAYLTIERNELSQKIDLGKWKKPLWDQSSSFNKWLWVTPALPVATVSLGLGYLLFSAPLFPAFVMIQFFVFVAVRPVTVKISKYWERDLLVFAGLSSGFRELANVDKRKQIRPMFSELDRLNKRLSVVSSPMLHFLLNLLLCWDVSTLKLLRKWEIQYGDWFRELLKQWEEEDSLMPMAYYHSWNSSAEFPVLDRDLTEVSAKEIRHPLIPQEKAVGNLIPSFAQKSPVLITGSNMSGKTTYLRSVGLAVVMGTAGFPLLGRDLRFPPLQVSCSIRNEDNLKEGISLFYAEVKRIAQILNKPFSAWEDGKSISRLVLLDEILKGTNTKERTIASRAILKELQNKPVWSLTTTHDLDLVQIPKLVLYHFTERIENQNMLFDYKLNEGVVHSTNALRILENEGIRLEWD